MRQKRVRLLSFFMIAPVIFLLVGCSPNGTAQTAAPIKANEATEILRLPKVEAVALKGKPLKVVVTTSIIGDVVAQVGGAAIDLTTLMGAGQDPHSYEPAARDLTAVAQADIIFVNGWDLEAGLIADLENIGADVPLVAVSANIQPLAFGEHTHAGETAVDADPHVWFNIQNTAQWVENIRQTLSQLDPTNTQLYQNNAELYLAELKELEVYAEAELATIPADKRFLVTNHDSFGYFIAAYDFELIGTVIPAASTVAEPSASDLAALIAEMEAHEVCTIFTETTINDTLAQTVAAELANCDDVQVLSLYTGALGPSGSAADSYLGMMRANVDTIVTGLSP